MKIFERDEKLNFVDENNVVLGYDYSGQCCENFGYFISYTIPVAIDFEADHAKDPRLDGFFFDREFFQELTYSDGIGDTVAIFRAIHPNGAVLYICLFNSHNGYYSHGFTCTHNGTEIRSGNL